MPKINGNTNTTPAPEQPKPKKAQLWSPNLTEADEDRAWELAKLISLGPDEIEVVYTRARSMQEFTDDRSIWSHMRGRNVEVWIPSNDPSDPDIWDEGWVVLANDTGLLWSSTGRMWFRPWTAIAQLTFNPEQDFTDETYDDIIRDMQRQREPEVSREEEERRRWLS